MKLNLKSTLLWGCICIAVTFSCKGPESTDISEPEKTVHIFFENYEKRGPRKAVNQLFLANNFIAPENADSVGAKLEQLTMEFGDNQGYEIIETSYYGKSIARITGIVKYSQMPIRFNFRFYQPGNGWRIQMFNYQTNFMKDLE